MTALFDHAKRYLALGFNVIPLKPDKTPNLPEWKQYQTTKVTEAEIDQWFNHSTNNIGVICGAISGNLAVIDFDDERAFRYCFRQGHDLFQTTLCVRTSKGIHVYLRLKEPTKSVNRKWPTLPLDIKSEGGYVVAPPSVHQSGITYAFIGETTEVMLMDEKSWGNFIAEMHDRAEEWPFIEKTIPFWNQGIRQNLALGVAGFCKKHLGYDESRVKRVLEGICSVTGDNEVAQRLSAVEGTFSKDDNAIAVMDWLGEELFESLKKLAPTKPTERRDSEGYRSPEAYFDEIIDAKTHEWKGDKFNPGRFVADILANERFLIRSTEGKNGRLWRYFNGKYVADGDTFVKRKLAAVIGKEYYPLTNRLQRIEVLDAVRNASFRDDAELVDNTNLIPVRNGVLNWRTSEIRPYDRDMDVFFFQLPMDFNPEAKAPKMDAWLHEIATEGGAETIIEYLAECLNRRPMKHHYIGHGPPHTAKTTLLKVIERTLGRDSIANVKLQRIARDRFFAAELQDKMANCYGDIGKGSIKELGQINSTTGTDTLNLERKGVDSKSGFEPYAKHLFMTNDLPRLDIEDVGDHVLEVLAFFERFGLIKFEQVYSADPIPGSTQKKKIEHFEDEICTDSELSGLLNMILKVMPDVVKNGPHTTKSAKETMMVYLRQSTPWLAFQIECLVPNSELEVKKEAMRNVFSYYKDMCGAGKVVVGDSKIKESLISLGIGERRDDKWVRNRTHWWTGISIDVTKLPIPEDGEADINGEPQVDKRIREIITEGTRKIAERPENPNIPKSAPGSPHGIDRFGYEPAKIAPGSPTISNSSHDDSEKTNSNGATAQDVGGVGAKDTGEKGEIEKSSRGGWG